ncbi:oxidoreductase [Pseudomaricurvus alkylphenolicus]|nr:oxidoreductase [Pseudomaricurvus alkylphenolicus]
MNDQAGFLTVKNVLVVLSHPNLEKSKVNKVLTDGITGIDGVTIKDIYAEYGDFAIDVEREQRDLTAHDIVVLQFPLYWYSCPALLKEWLDKVMVRNFAYGKHGKALVDKKLMLAVTAGGPEETYRATGSNEYPVEEFLKVFELTAKFCSMSYDKPLILHNTYRITDEDIAAHSNHYRDLLSTYVASE